MKEVFVLKDGDLCIEVRPGAVKTACRYDKGVSVDPALTAALDALMRQAATEVVFVDGTSHVASSLGGRRTLYPCSCLP